MTSSPENMLRVRRLFQEQTGLAAVALGIQHYQPDGGGYHEGNDLLQAGSRLTSDYSKRESAKDRPGNNYASAIDIGYFDVVKNGKHVTLRDLGRFTERNWGAPDAQWMRECIYSLDGRTVKRLDRLGIRSSGDNSHLTHNHYSKFRQDTSDSPYQFFARFWREVSSVDTASLPTGDNMAILLQVQGSDNVYVSDYFQYRGIDYPTFRFYVDVCKLPYQLVQDEAALRARGGKPDAEEGGTTVLTLTDTQISMLSERGATGGISADELKSIMEDAAFKGAQRAESE